MRRSFMRWIATVLTASMIMGGSVTPVSALEITDAIPGVLSEDITDGSVIEAVSVEDMAEDRNEEAVDPAVLEVVSEDEAVNNEGAAPVWDGYIPDKFLNTQDDDISIESSVTAMDEINEGELESKYITPAEYIPDLKDQDPLGTCWTFAVMASNEGYLIKNKGKSRSIDLSERALAYFIYCLKDINDPLGNTLGDYNLPKIPFNNVRNIYDIGGAPFDAAVFLSNWGTPIDESRAPYSELVKMGKSPTLTDTKHKGEDALDDKLCYDPEFHLQGYRLIGDRAGIKQAIKENGIVTTSYFHDSGSHNPKKINFYNSENHAYNSGSYHADDTNHTVCIIGWDDDFDKNRFNEICRPENNGAWLIRNSWGSDWGEGGNFWLSYEDKSFAGVITFMPEDKNNYDNNYFYDGASGDSDSGRGSAGEWRAANVFKAASDEKLEAVSIAMESTDVDYSVQIYKNPTDPMNPDSGTPMLAEGAVKGKFSYQGYYTIPLNASIDLKKDDIFAVVFTLSNDKKGTYAYIEENKTKSWITYKAQIEKGQSLYSTVKNSWYDIAKEGHCFRIHAFTKNVTDKPAHNAETINAELYRVNSADGKVRLSDFSASLNKVLTDKYGAEEAVKWSFKDPDTILTANNDQPTIKVDVVKDDGGNKTYDYILMNVTDVSFDAFENLKPTMYTGSDPIKLVTYASYVGYKLKKNLLSNYATSNMNILRLGTDDNFAYIVGEGTVTLSSNLFLEGSNDPIKTASMTINVTKNPKAEVHVSGNVVRIAPPSEIKAESAGGEETSDVTSFDQITDGYVIVRGYKYFLEDMTEGNSTVFVSEDPSVLKIGKYDKETRRSELIITGTGYVNVSCKVDGKTIRTLRFNVTAPSVSLEKTTLNFDSALTDSVDVLDIYASADIVSVNVTDKNRNAVTDFEVNKEAGRTYSVRYKGSAASANLDGFLRIKLSGSSEDIYRPVSIKVKSTVLKATVKQTAKVDTLYFNPGSSIGNLSVTLNTGEVESVRLMDTGRNSGPLAYGVYDPWYNDESEEVSSDNIAYGSEFAIYCVSGDNVKNNKGTLEITVSGYKNPIKKDITIAYMTSNIKATAVNTGVMTSESGDVLAGNKVRFKVTNTTAKCPEEYYEPDIQIADKDGNSLASKYSGIYEEGGVFALIPKTGTKITASGEDVFVTVSDDMHSSSVKIKLRIKGITSAKAALVLDKTTIQMQRYDSASVNKALTYDMGISFKNCGGLSDLLSNLSVNAIDDKSSDALKDNKLKLEYVQNKSVIRVSYPGGNAPAAGTYKYRLSIGKDKIGAAKDISVNLTLRIKDTPLNGACKTSLVGKLDVLDRDSYVEIIPKFSNLPTDSGHRITNVMIQGEGSDKFDYFFNTDNGRMSITNKDGVSVSTADKYEFIIVYSVDIGDGQLTATSGKIKIPVTQGKVMSSIKGTSVYSNMLRFQKEKLDITLCNKAGDEIDIEKIELTNPNADFELIKEGDQYYIGYTPNGAVKKGKTYTLKFNVYPKYRAANSKPVMLTYKIGVAE